MRSLTASLLVALAALLPTPGHAANLWQSLSLGVGAQGAWFNGPEEQESLQDLEATGRGAFSITPHISVIGGAAYGFGDSYLRSSLGFRLTATDVNDQNFSVGLGVSRHFRSEPGPMDEWVAEGAMGWRPLASSEVTLTASAGVGLDTNRRLITAGFIIPLKLTIGQ